MAQLAATVAKDEKMAWELSEPDSPTVSHASSSSFIHAPPNPPGTPPSSPSSRPVFASRSRDDVLLRDQVEPSAAVSKGPRKNALRSKDKVEILKEEMAS